MPPHNEKLKGVRKTALRVAMAVNITDSAAFPLAKADMKLLIFPPGQQETSIIPIAIVGVIKLFMANTKMNVINGKTTNCDRNPTRGNFGE